MKRAVCNDYLDFIHVPSEKYAEDFCKEFCVPKSKVIVCPFGVSDKYEEFKNSSVPIDLNIPGHYALAIGRSNRDYDFLLKSWKDIDIPLVIVCDQWGENSEEIPSNVILIDSIHGTQQFPLIMNCDVLVLAIKDSSIPSGDTVLLTAMSFGKKVIVSKPSALAGMYIAENVNGVTFEKRQEDLKKAMNSALENSSLGRSARKSYEENYSQYAMGNNIGKYLASGVL